MTPMASLRRSRLLLLVGAVVAVVVGVVLLSVDGAGSDSGAEVVSDSSAKAGWMTIEYRGIRVDIPSGWERLEGCEVPWEHWGPEGASCASDGGVYLSSSTMYDPARGPGIRRTELDSGSDGWGGYVYVGDLAVYASDRDRDLVETMLASGRVIAN
jgi:hypothetical protein